jgi:hypothetical protein
MFQAFGQPFNETPEKGSWPLRWDEAGSRCVRAAGLVRLCGRTRGVGNLTIALIDGAVDARHGSLRDGHIKVIDRARTASSAATQHATFIASAFAGAEPACLGLVPVCRILSIGVVDEEMLQGTCPPRQTAGRLASAVDLASTQGASIIQISLTLRFLAYEAHPLNDAVAAAVHRGAVIVVAAAESQFSLSNPLFWIPGVIPVFGADHAGFPLASWHGPVIPSVSSLLAPAIDIPGAVLPDGTGSRSGSSFAACFVTAAVALMCSALPGVAPRDAAIRLLGTPGTFRRDAAPAVLDADSSFESHPAVQRVTYVQW